WGISSDRGSCVRGPREVLDMVVYTNRMEAKNPAFQGYLLLRAGFVVAPVLFGIDKFFNWMADWPQYLAPWVNHLMPGTAQQCMYAVGGIEIVAGLAVLFSPKW